MNSLATLSVWESDVLGVRVGTISPDKVPPVDAIRSENRGLFDVVFVSCPKWVEQRSGRVAIDYLYDMEMSVSEELTKAAPASRLVYPGVKLIEVVRSSVIESRFLRDPKLLMKSQDRYIRWLSGHQAYVPEDYPNSAFMVPVDDADGARRISLIAVHMISRGGGIGTRLVMGAFAAEPDKKIWRVRVSARNRRALRFYETIGFRVKDVSTVFNVWV